jgi:hypothetical protein
VVAADQPGNAIYNPAPEVTHTVVVLDNRVTIALIGAPNPVFVSNPITFNATVASPAGTPTGSILFLDGTVPLGTISLTGAFASLTTSTLTVGTHIITAVYSGDAVFATVTSAPLSVLVEDFRLTIANPDLTIPHGGTAVYNLTVTTVGGAYMASTIQFSLTGYPDHSPVTFNPPQVVTGSGTTHFTLTIQTPDYPVGPWNGASLPRRGLPLACVSLATFFALGRRRRRFRSRLTQIATWLLAFALSTTMVSLSGCTWGAEPFSMTVTATSGALSRSVGAHLVSE